MDKVLELLAQLPNFSSSALPVTDRIMRDTFWVGVYPGMMEVMIGFMVETVGEFIAR